MQTFESILEVVKWPLVVVAALLIFRRPVNSLLGRVTSLGKDGLKANPSTEQSSPGQERFPRDNEQLSDQDSASLVQRRRAIRQHLADGGLASQGESTDYLVRLLAITQLHLNFEQIYRAIFGSQIFFLRRANENRISGISRELAVNHFSNVQSSFAPSFDGWDLRGYMRFLLDAELLGERDGAYLITELGVDFLQWLSRYGIPEGKSL